MTKRSIVWALSREKLQKILDESSSIVEVLTKLGLNAYNGSGRTLYRRIFETEEFNFEKFNLNKKITNENRGLEKRRPTEFYLNQKTSANRTRIKHRLIEEKLIPYKCRDCSNEGSHNGKSLSLQIEHIDGDSTNNQLNNLCFLCPNCHSQTPTYAGRKATKPKIYESAIAREARIHRTRRFHVTKEQLAVLIQCYPMVEIGKMFGVSDNAVRKRGRLFGLL